MRYRFRLFLVAAGLCMSVSAAYADALILKGVVAFSETREPLAGVSVYLDGSSFHTVTDKAGNFSLYIPNRVNTSLIVRSVDHQMMSVNNPYEAMPDTIFLKLRSLQLAAAVVYPLPFDREPLLKLFRRQFLGTTEAGRSCDIKNEDDIRFMYDKPKNTIRAMSDNPLVISNKYLGYDLVFDMQHFVSQLKKTESLESVAYTVYFGTCSFEDLSKGKASFRKKRDLVYGHSFRALINSILGGDIGKSDFWIINKVKPIESLNELAWSVSDTLSTRSIQINKTPERVNIYSDMKGMVYDKLKVQLKSKSLLSTIYFLNNTYTVDNYGNVDNIMEVMFTGNMGMQKVGDMLPLDYMPAE